MSSKKRNKGSAHPPGPVPSRPLKLGFLAGLLILAAGGALIYQRYRSDRVPGPPQQAQPSATPRPPKQKEVFGAYAGSASCRECHEEEFDAWVNSHHGRAERVGSAALDQQAFIPARTFQHGSQHTTLSETNGRFEATLLRATNRYETFPIQRVLGEDPLRQFLVSFPGGRMQALEAAYDPKRNEWFNVYGNEDRQPGEWGHWTGRGMNWNSMCASCHNTRVRKNYDEGTDTYSTAMAEMTVGCEACHGPLKAHNEWQKQFGKSNRKDPTLLRLTASQSMENCGFCHARRSDLTGDFKPGDDFFEHMRLSMVDGSELYYPDGQVHEEDYEYSAYLGSRMHARGVRCWDCHEPHTAKTKLPGNWLCLRCHNGSDTNAPVINVSLHSHHQVFGFDTNGQPVNLDLLAYKPAAIKETGGECVNCHMPQTVYMQRHWRHDHGFTIPDPLLTKQFHIPNACNRCHQDKTVDWAIEWADRWYGAKMERPSRKRAQVIAGARLDENSARDGLLHLLATEEIPYWRAVAAGLLLPSAAEPPVRDALVGGLRDTNALVREVCIRALEPAAESDRARLGAVIDERLNDPVRSVRVEAAWVLRASLDPASKAASELLYSLQLNADQPAGQMQKGVYALARNHPEEALAHYAKAVVWDPNSAVIHHDFAIVLSRLERGKEAVDELRKACALEPRNAEYQYLLGLGFNELGQPERALEALETAVKLDPKFARGWYNLGLALNAAGRTDEGLRALVRAESLTPNDAGIPYARATILAPLGRTSEARQAANRALEIQPGYPPAEELLRSLP